MSVFADPTGTSSQRKSGLAPRKIRTLNGKTVGLLNNTKVKADYILDAIAEVLSERYDIKDFVRVTKAHFARPMSDEIADEMAAKCDVVISAIGSCGACSVSTVADGIIFEQRGVQSAAILTDAFIRAGNAMARLYGLADYHYATLPHPVENLSREESLAGVRKIVDEIEAILGVIHVASEEDAPLAAATR